MTDDLRVALIGAGNISAIYVKMLGQLPGVRVVGVADVIADKAVEVAATSPGARAMTVDEAASGASDVDLAVNLTIPSAHAEMTLAAIEGGRHVYTEKPFATTSHDGKKILTAAKAKDVRVGCAPDTVLGTGVQTARQIIDSGRVGEAVAASAFFIGRGPDNWHPNPDFFYQQGAGPLYDVGPYYIATLLQLLGPVRRVTAFARPSWKERTVSSGVNVGHVIEVDVDTHITASLEHESGALSTLIATFDVHSSRVPRVEIWGADGSVSVPDPNTFAGDVDVFTPGGTWETSPRTAGIKDTQRGTGVADMARAIRHDEPHRASAEMGYHGLDVMESIIQAAHDGKAVDIDSTFERPALMPLADFSYFAS